MLAPHVTLYIPVGPRSSCNRYDASACRIERIEFDTTTHLATGFDAIIDVPGAFSPSINPTERLIAYDQVMMNRLQVSVKDMTTGETAALRDGDKSSWRTDGTLFFGIQDEAPSSADRWTDVGRVTLTQAPLSWNGSTDRILGSSPWFVGGADSTDCSAEDPFFHAQHGSWMAFHNSPYRDGLGPTHTCPFVAGIVNQDLKNPQPVVADIEASSWVEGETFWHFDMGVLPSPRPMSMPPPPTGCAHLAA